MITQNMVEYAGTAPVFNDGASIVPFLNGSIPLHQILCYLKKNLDVKTLYFRQK